MKQNIRGIRAIVALMALSLSIGMGNVFAEEVEFTTSAHGDWVLRCPKDKKAGVENPCTLIQQILPEESKSPIVTILFVRAGNPPGLHAILRLPLGVALPTGVGIQIDKGEVSKWRFNHCEPGGCIAPSKVSAELRKKLQAGNKANISFHAISGKKVTVPASLRGITAGFKALERK